MPWVGAVVWSAPLQSCLTLMAHARHISAALTPTHQDCSLLDVCIMYCSCTAALPTPVLLLLWLLYDAGDKVRVCGAELVANQQSEALEAAKTCYLNLHGNGVHRLVNQPLMQHQTSH